MSKDNEVILIHTELAEPRHRFIRSDRGLYTIMLIGILFVVGFATPIANALGLAPNIVHWALYFALIILGVVIYRTRLTSWRYSLTSAGFYVDRVSGKREKPEVEIPLKRIEYIGPYDKARLEKEGRKPGPNVRWGKLEDSLMILYKEDKVKKAVCITPSETLREKLEEPWKTSNP